MTTVVRTYLAYLATLALGYLVFALLGRADYRWRGKLSPLSVVLQVAVFALHANLSYLFLPAIWPAMPQLGQRPLLNALGLVFLGFGLAVALAAMAQLGLWRTVGQPRPGFQGSGLYRISRNPQIVGYGIALLGWGLLWPSLHMMGWLATYALMARWIVASEEEHLERKFGEAYHDYCRQVPRYLGFP